MTPLPALPDDRTRLNQEFRVLLRSVQLHAVAHGMAIERDPEDLGTIRHEAATKQDQAMEAAEAFVAALTHGAHADTARLEAEPNYEAGVKAYHETVMYWAPELLSSPEHIAQLVERIVDAATRSTQEGNQV